MCSEQANCQEIVILLHFSRISGETRTNLHVLFVQIEPPLFSRFYALKVSFQLPLITVNNVNEQFIQTLFSGHFIPANFLPAKAARFVYI